MNYLFPQSPCSKDPCQNGGSCVALYEKNDFNCVCPAEFKGRHCESKSFLHRSIGYKHGPQPPTPHMAMLDRRHIDAVDPRFPHKLTSTHQFVPPFDQIQPPAIPHFHTNFLETTLLLTEQRTLHSTLYTKPTDKGLLLHHTFHP